MKNHDELTIFVAWIGYLKWLLLTIDKFPKKMRFTFSDRISSIALDIVEDLIEARYSRDKGQLLKKVNLKIEKLRVLCRICFELKAFSHEAYEHSTRSLNEVGKMLGGWIKHQKEK